MAEPAYRCGLCGATSTYRNEPFTDPEQVQAHGQGKSDEQHKGLDKARMAEHVESIGEAEDEPAQPAESTPSEAEAPQQATAGSPQGPSEPDLPDAEDEASPSDPPRSCGHCSTSNQLVKQAEEPLDGESIRLRTGRVVDMVEGERFCVNCGAITEPDGTVHR